VSSRQQQFVDATMRKRGEEAVHARTELQCLRALLFSRFEDDLTAPTSVE
jgi:hypothetical protein